MGGDNPYGSNRAARRRKKAEDRRAARRKPKMFPKFLPVPLPSPTSLSAPHVLSGFAPGTLRVEESKQPNVLKLTHNPLGFGPAADDNGTPLPQSESP
jgi:hypothetical protein